MVPSKYPCISNFNSITCANNVLEEILLKHRRHVRSFDFMSQINLTNINFAQMGMYDFKLNNA